MMEWYNEPLHWKAEGAALTVTTGAKTDFWRTTHYGFIRDDGHFYYQTVQGDFEFTAQFSGQYRDLYDQAGIMLRLDAENWLKCGVEFVEGIQQASVVVTRQFSDWSVTPMAANPPTFWLRIKRAGDAVEVFHGQESALLRVAYFPPVSPVQVGLMCASPQGDGFTVHFDHYQLLL